LLKERASPDPNDHPVSSQTPWSLAKVLSLQ